MPDDGFTIIWNTFISLLLFFTFIQSPYRIAFVGNDDIIWLVLDGLVDLIFLIDLVLNFFMAYYNDEYILIDTRRKIAFKYLLTWFWIDLLAIIPFNFIIPDSGNGNSDFSSLIRLIKLPRLYKLVTVVPIGKIFRSLERRSTIFSHLQEFLKIGAAFERLIFTLLTFALIVHIVACGLVIIANIENRGPETWIARKSYYDETNINLYLSAVYFCITTITTVGFGDITPETSLEKSYIAIIMMLGVVGFSFATSTMTSLMTSLDSANARLKQKLATLEEIKNKYQIGAGLYEELRQALKFEVE